MIIFFGPAGAGKSVQGQLLAARYGWRWLSAGQLLRDTRDPQLLKEMQSGGLANSEKVNEIFEDALIKAKDIDGVISDGFPRELSQAKWLVDALPKHERSIALVVVLEVPRSEIDNRLKLRGRADDTPDAIEQRLSIYRQEVYPILNYFAEKGLKIAHIDGTGSVGQVHDRVVFELQAINLNPAV
ncbi:nucleoside monophosphate kinase [Candidatus Saccharibacteria bacterium]|jgi:adenylate kinase|nr:nucleoside monophosphate kinase [Candidatus Saccharibacteria bacterium]MCA9312818.1 nucleoside monophosphate kinase [Candidatus Saccharibacteria bacterium]